jgi:hypothetical protein
MDTGNESESTSTADVTLAPGAFVAIHETNGLNCAFNEVMIGIHFAQTKSICAGLNFGYRVQTTVTDPPQGTQVGDPAMHGCPNNYFIQGVAPTGDDESLTCVALQTSSSVALTYSGTSMDSNGKTQSDIYNITKPKMHACPVNFAMVGIQQDRNDLFCAD